MATFSDASGNGWKMPDLRTDEGSLPVEFQPDSGQFVATMPDQTTARAYTWADLTALATAKMRRARVRIEIPFVLSDTGRRGTAIGAHPKSNQPLVRWQNGHTEVYAGNGVPLRPDTDIDELTRLREAASHAARLVTRFLEDHRISLNVAAMVRKAIEAAVEADPESAP